MEIIVCIKQVPDTMEVRIDPVTNNLVREGIPSILNPYDRTAIEVALDLREQNGGRVTVFSMGPRQAARELELALDLGADRAVLLCDRAFAGSDTLATAYALSEAIRAVPFDLILCGNEAVDGCTGQVGPGIAENLGVPSFTCVSGIQCDRGRATLLRTTGKSEDTWRCALPLVACLLKAEFRRAPQTSGKKPALTDASGMDPRRIGSAGSPTKVASISTGKRPYDYLQVDYRWSLEERMEYIFNGGLAAKAVKLIHDSAPRQADVIYQILTGGTQA